MTAHDLQLEMVEPIGMRRTQAFVNRGHADDGTPIGHSFEEIDMPMYPDDARLAGRELREIRVALGLSLRDAARAIGISVAQVSDIERGRARCNKEALLDAYHASLSGVKR